VNNLGSIIQILVFVLVIAGPTIGAIAKKVKAHADAKRREVEQNKRRIETIRTGRGGETEPDEPQVQTSDQSRRARLEELARQRQAQIEELRRRAAARRAQVSGQQAPPQRPQQTPPQRQPQQPSSHRSSTQSTRPPPVKTSSHSSTQSTRPPPVPMSQQQQQQQSRGSIEARRRAEIARRQAEIRARREQAERARRQAEQEQARRQPKRTPRAPQEAAPPVAIVKPPERQVGPGLDIAGTVRDPRSLRQAIVLTEVLGPPVGLRGPGAGF